MLFGLGVQSLTLIPWNRCLTLVAVPFSIEANAPLLLLLVGDLDLVHSLPEETFILARQSSSASPLIIHHTSATKLGEVLLHTFTVCWSEGGGTSRTGGRLDYTTLVPVLAQVMLAVPYMTQEVGWGTAGL